MYEKGEVLLTDGRFRINTLRYSMDRTHNFVEHNCGEQSPWPGSWRFYAAGRTPMGKCCSTCNVGPPEGLQAVFWFLKDEEDWG